jgi:hypothetical protein
LAGSVFTAERLLRAALLGVAMAVEIRHILRLHFDPSGSVDADGTAAVVVPFPDSLIVAAVLDAALTCLVNADADAEADPDADTRQAVLGQVLDLAALTDRPARPP